MLDLQCNMVITSNMVSCLAESEPAYKFCYYNFYIVFVLLIWLFSFIFIFKVTQQNRNVVLKDNMRITVNNEKRTASRLVNAPSKKLSSEQIAKEKERLLQLEKVYANKIRQLKQTSTIATNVLPVENKENKDDLAPVVKKEIPRLEKIALSMNTIDLTDDNEIDDRPCKRRRSLMELNPSTKPNIEVKATRLSRGSQSSVVEENKIEIDFPEGKSFLRLLRQQVKLAPPSKNVSMGHVRTGKAHMRLHGCAV